MKHLKLPSVLLVGGCLALALPATAQQTQQEPAATPGQTEQMGQQGAPQGTQQLQAEPAPAGMDEQAVRELQQALSDAGYEVMVDGIWGQQTRTALEEFQQQEGLEATGEPDQETLSALDLDHLDTGMTGMTPGAGAGAGAAGAGGQQQPGMQEQPGATQEDPATQQGGQQPATRQ
jgi:hypothetical protein